MNSLAITSICALIIALLGCIFIYFISRKFYNKGYAIRLSIATLIEITFMVFMLVSVGTIIFVMIDVVKLIMEFNNISSMSNLEVYGSFFNSSWAFKLSAMFIVITTAIISSGLAKTVSKFLFPALAKYEESEIFKEQDIIFEEWWNSKVKWLKIKSK